MLGQLATLIANPGTHTHVLGIDLGTTHSVGSAIRLAPGEAPGTASCQTLPLQQPTREGPVTAVRVPSVVVLDPDGSTWVGEGARRLRSRPERGWPVHEHSLFFDCKNDMGLRKRYPSAPEDLDRPWKVAGHILRFIVQKATEANGMPQRVTVTVPAAFQLAQRKDTLAAALMAGLDLQEHDLLDEPTAALLDWLVQHPESDLLHRRVPVHVLVFDFGGGTCDVSIAELGAPRPGSPVPARLLATSRYHRLGGGDLDDAIVGEHLLPKLLKANDLGPLDLTWAEKRRILFPHLRGTAEALKESLCREVERLEAFGHFHSPHHASLTTTLPTLTLHVSGRELHLPTPSLDLPSFEKILGPFLDPDHLGARETEFRLSQSIFAPLTDALERARMDPTDLDAVLLVGGSSAIFQVRQALQRMFPKAAILRFANPDDAKTCVSRGAAWHALAVQVTGRPLIQPVTPDELALVTQGSAPLTLVPSGSPLPFPPDGGFMRVDLLAVPRSGAEAMKLELRAQGAGRTVLEERWELAVEVRKDDPITLEYRLTASQDFECRAWLAKHPQDVFEVHHQNPLTHTVNPNAIRARIEETEAVLREKPRLGPADTNAFEALAKDYAEIGQLEKAQECLRIASRLDDRESAARLNLMGIYYGRLGDQDREMKEYREALRLEPRWEIPRFNLALVHSSQGRHEEALKELAVDPNPTPPTLAQRAQILLTLGRRREAEREAGRALACSEPPELLGSWERLWYIKAAKLADRADLLARAQSAPPQDRAATESPVQGDLPVLRRRP